MNKVRKKGSIKEKESMRKRDREKERKKNNRKERDVKNVSLNICTNP